MKVIAKHRIVVAGLLLFLFVIPFVAKPIHSHHYNKTCTENRQAQHNSDDCPICQFTISTFVQAVAFASIDFPAFNFQKPFTYHKNTCSGISFSYHLRGPPFSDK
jgi:hypothetical protein